MLKIYNDLTRQKEAFKPIKKGKVGMYVCGPTIYDYGHLGHGMSAVVFDMIRRYLIYSGYKVIFVFNYTDIDDKMIDRANKEGVAVKALADKFTEIYDKDYELLGIMKPTYRPKATEFIKEMVELIKILEKKGFTYIIAGDGVYYNVSKFKGYGKLSHQNLEELKAGARVGVDLRKKHPEDFVLWKFKKSGEPSWKSPWGDGRPGWHIECSAMSNKLIGPTLDIHGGGQDLIFPHHEDEIAQSEAANEKQFANYWMHNGFLQINKEKMSKSLGNFFTIGEALKKWDSKVIRYLFLSIYYKAGINFSEESLDSARNSLEKIQNFYNELLFLDERRIYGKIDYKIADYRKKFRRAMDDDFNVAEALSVVFNLIEGFFKKKDNLNKKVLKNLIKFMGEFNSVFAVLKAKERIPKEILKLVELREKLREQKRWSEADKIRIEIQDLGYIIDDRPDGSRIRKINLA